MYRLPPETDLAFLRGARLLQVCIGVNEVILHFDDDLRITLLSDFAVAPKGEASARYTEPAAGCPALVRLLDEGIADAAVAAHGGLILRLDSGAMIEAFDTSDQYESFWIEGKQRRIIV